MKVERRIVIKAYTWIEVKTWRRGKEEKGREKIKRYWKEEERNGG